MRERQTALSQMTEETAAPKLRVYLSLSLALVVCGFVAFFFDIYIARSMRVDSFVPGDLRAVVRFAEVFAHSLGICCILLTVFVLAPSIRIKLWRVAGCALLPGLVVTLAKVLVHRNRPKSLESFPDSVWQTFGSFFPAITEKDTSLLTESSIQSFASGHSACAVGLAVGLSWLFPRGRWLFAFFAALAMLQRIQCEAHFLSDTLFGGAVAAIIAGRYLSHGWESKIFAKIEGSVKPSENA